MNRNPRAARTAAQITLIAIAGALFLLLLLPGCSFLQPAADQAGRGIKRYCTELPYALRLENRGAINAAAAPHSGKITCAADPAEP